MGRFTVIIICIILICGAMFYFISVPRNVSDVTAAGGLLDLTGEDFSGTLFLLNGEWEYYEGILYTPEDFANKAANVGDPELDKTFINVPMAWHHAESPLYGYATFRLIVKTDEPELLMFVPEIMDASIVWINGRKVFEAGVIRRVGTT